MININEQMNSTACFPGIFMQTHMKMSTRLIAYKSNRSIWFTLLLHLPSHNSNPRVEVISIYVTLLFLHI